MRRVTALLTLFLTSVSLASPIAPAGDIGLRHDVQMLADYGAIRSPTMAWPMAWDAILADLEAELRRICDPDAVDARAKADQAALVARHGGRAAVVARGSFSGTPAPGERAVYG